MERIIRYHIFRSLGAATLSHERRNLLFQFKTVKCHPDTREPYYQTDVQPYRYLLLHDRSDMNVEPWKNKVFLCGKKSLEHYTDSRLTSDDKHLLNSHECTKLVDIYDNHEKLFRKYYGYLDTCSQKLSNEKFLTHDDKMSLMYFNRRLQMFLEAGRPFVKREAEYIHMCLKAVKLP